MKFQYSVNFFPAAAVCPQNGDYFWGHSYLKPEKKTCCGSCKAELPLKRIHSPSTVLLKPETDYIRKNSGLACSGPAHSITQSRSNSGYSAEAPDIQPGLRRTKFDHHCNQFEPGKQQSRGLKTGRI